MKKLWRFIPYEQHSAAINMAVDESMLDAHLQGLVPATLRVYGFDPPALSLGLNQKLPPGVVQRARSAGFEVVRRPTGGRAVLHLGDITYSFVGSSAPDADKLTSERFLLPSILGAYRQICQGLIFAFQYLGLKAQLGEQNASAHHDCFSTTTAADVRVQGKKLVGSAQLRRKTAVLQHGTIILRQDQDLMSFLFGAKTQPSKTRKHDRSQHSNGSIQHTQRRDNFPRHGNLNDLLEQEISVTELQTALMHGFQDAFGATFVIGNLSEHEHQSVRSLMSAKKGGI